VEIGSSHTGEGEQVATDNNVVRLPRDWLGPREDLIPFGPNEVDEPTQPIGAEAFWDESSAEVQDAWRAPPPGDAASAVQPPAVEPSEPAGSHAHANERGEANRSHVRAVSRLRRLSGRPVVAVAGALAAIAVGAAFAVPGSTAHRTGDDKVVASDAVPTTGVLGISRRLPTKPDRGGAARLPSAFERGLRRELRIAASVARGRATKAHAAASRPATSAAQPVTTPVQTPASDATSSGEVNTGPSSSSDSAGDSAGGSPVGPVGPGATFGPGQLQ
jgi:hypothetical protein